MTIDPQNVMRYLIKEHGLSPEIAAGICGNISVESDFDPEAENENSGAYGLCQWLGVRKIALNHHADYDYLRPVYIGNWQIQLDFAMYELEDDPFNGWDELQQAISPQEAARIFCERFERPGDDGSLIERIAAAKEIYDEWMSDKAIQIERHGMIIMKKGGKG